MLTEKICSKCKNLKSLELFRKNKQTKDGLMHVCKECIKIVDKIYREKNAGYNKEYVKNNSEKIKQYQKEYQIKNQKKIKDQKLDYHSKNKDKLNEYRRNHRKSYSHVRIANNLRTRVRMAVKRKNNTKVDSTTKMLGCDIFSFKKYLESKFTKGMSWENYGSDGWHIDHIIPCTSFDLADPEQQKICFHYTNLQPLWATTAIAIFYGEDNSYIGNIEKRNKITKKDTNDC